METKKCDDKKALNLAYGGQALIEGVLMRGPDSYAITVKKEDGTFYKEKVDCKALTKRFKILGTPFIRGIVGFFENMILGFKVLNKSAEIAFPEESKGGKELSVFTTILTLLLALSIALTFFVAGPYFLTGVFKFDDTRNPWLYNFISGAIRMVFFFTYLYAISFMKDTKRLFAYHGAEHKTINAYENNLELNVENVKKSKRLHPRCGTSFIFIVFLITIVVFPLFNIYFNSQAWYIELPKFLKKIVIILSHIVVGMPIVASVSYELLKLSAKFEKNPLVKALVSPGLFFQLLTTREPDDDMIKTSILSLNMVLGVESCNVLRSVADNDIHIAKLDTI